MRTCRLLTLIPIALALASGARAAEWPHIAGQGTDWVNSLEGAQWPTIADGAAIAAETRIAEVERRYPKPFAFELGARYWYSSGTTKFGFSNGDPAFGDPTSTLDWKGTQGQSGEVFGRVDHRPTSLFAKATVGGGFLQNGTFIDRDFFAGQLSFSDTTSQISGNDLRYATADIGLSYEVPQYGARFSGFVGYHYWHEKTTAYGLVCNTTAVLQLFCGPPGFQRLSPDVTVMLYEPTWHAMRIGGEARLRLDRRWTLTGEVAIIPIAWLDNKDSHLLRSDLGTSPNILTSGYGWGGMAEVFVNYAITPQLEIGVGARYWGLTTYKGSVDFGPAFNPEYKLDNFDTSRYGVLAQIKGRF